MKVKNMTHRDILDFLQHARTTARQIDLLNKVQIPEGYLKTITETVQALGESIHKFNGGVKSDDQRSMPSVS